MNPRLEEELPSDLMLFEAEAHASEDEKANRPWRLMIVDDDEDVHTATIFALDKVQILGRKLEFLHAYSGEEARAMLARERDVGVILLDVVMEREDAGLTLVRFIREELHLSEVRIILRTGQPGYAPEIEAIRDYDINDYKTKSELTRAKLFTTLTASMRSYDQIRAINAGRRGLDRIVRGSAELIALSGRREFAGGVIAQLSDLLGLPGEGLVCAPEFVDGSGAACYGVIAATGPFAALLDETLDSLPEPVLRERLGNALQQRSNLFDHHGTTLYVGSGAGHDLLVHLKTPFPPSAVDRKMLEVFCTNIAVCLDNVALVSRLRSQAFFDPLLGLPNRLHLIEDVDAMIHRGQGDDYGVTLVDIDHFAEINDALGHRYGDRLLQAVAQRLRAYLPAEVLLARVAGDAFGIFGRRYRLPPAGVLGQFLRPFEVDGVHQTLSATLGLANLADVEGSGVDALKAASIALKRAKQSQRGHYAYFTRDMGVEIRARVKLLEDLRGAFASEQLFLHYQPQVNLDDDHLVGLEALIRWRDPDEQFVAPDRFIPLAEHSGLIVPVGEWVMRTAMLQQRQLCEEGYCGIWMAINVSAVQFRHPDFLATVDSALAASGVDPSLIELEITESVAMLEADYMLSMFDQLKARGLQIAVDDFGTGFSSLSYLQKLAIDRLKIDRSFVKQISLTSGARCIAAMVVDLGRSLGLNVIAEGVEDEAQARRLRELGCHEAQGFYYARPMDEQNLRGWIQRRGEP
ncbi:MAG TPA: EAL domain-containing protein [Rhodocyclaceae bacterium]|nr:EAL domain-containing protein [Rhodocyclaceae bacterium]